MQRNQRISMSDKLSICPHIIISSWLLYQLIQHFYVTEAIKILLTPFIEKFKYKIKYVQS